MIRWKLISDFVPITLTLLALPLIYTCKTINQIVMFRQYFQRKRENI